MTTLLLIAIALMLLFGRERAHDFLKVLATLFLMALPVAILIWVLFVAPARARHQREQAHACRMHSPECETE